MAGHAPTWHDWEVSECIGKGSFGAVYKIQKNIFGDMSYAALKVISIPRDESEIDELRAEHMDELSISKTLERQLHSIATEYKLMDRVKHCPNIVHCDDIQYTQHKDDPGWDIFIKMELLTPLMKVLDRMNDESEVIRLGIEMCNALTACQEQGIIHRDIKPQNIFISAGGTFKLGDFGIAKVMKSSGGATVRTGTFNYMAPEVERNPRYDATVDLYSLGIVLYFLLNERRLPFLPLPPAPITAEDREQANRKRFSGVPIPAPVHGSSQLKDIVLKACAYDPKNRFRSAAEMKQALEALKPAARTPRFPEENDDDRTVRQAPAYRPAPADMDEDATVRATPTTQESQKLVDLLKNIQSAASQPSAYSYVPPKQDAVTPTAPRHTPAAPYSYVPPKQDAVTPTPPKQTSPEPYSYVPPRQDAVTPTPPKQTPPEPYSYVPPRQTPPEPQSSIPPKQDPPKKQPAGEKNHTTPPRTGSTKVETHKKRKSAFSRVALILLVLVIGFAAFTIIGSRREPVPATTTLGTDHYSLEEIGRIEDPSRDLYMSGSYLSTLHSDDGLNAVYSYTGELLEGARFDRISSLGNGLLKCTSASDSLNNLSLISMDGQVFFQDDACLIEWGSRQSEQSRRYLLVYKADAETTDEEAYLINVADGYVSTWHSSSSGGTMYTGTLRVYDVQEGRFVPNLPTVTRNDHLEICGNSIVIKTGEKAYTMYNSNGEVLAELDVSPNVGCGYVIINRQSTYYVIDDTGKQTYTVNKGLYSAVHDEPYLKMDDNVIDVHGNVILEGYKVSDFYDGLFLFYTDPDHYGLVDPNGTVVIPAKYDYISDLGNGYFYGKTGKTYSLLHRDGVLISGLESSPYNLVVENKEQLFVINDRTFSIPKTVNRYPTVLADGMVALRSEDTGMYTVYDLFTGQPLLSNEYEAVGYVHDHLYVYQDGGWTVYRVQFNR